MADALSRPVDLAVVDASAADIDHTAQHVDAVQLAGHDASPVVLPTPESLAQAQLENREEIDQYYSSTSLKLKLLPSSPEPGSLPLLCDVGQTPARPVVPRSLVPGILRLMHGIAHPGGRATLRLIRARYVCKILTPYLTPMKVSLILIISIRALWGYFICTPKREHG